VTLTGRRKELLEQVVLEAGAVVEQALIVPTDVRDPASVRALFTQTKEAFGRLACARPGILALHDLDASWVHRNAP